MKRECTCVDISEKDNGYYGTKRAAMARRDARDLIVAEFLQEPKTGGPEIFYAEIGHATAALLTTDWIPDLHAGRAKPPSRVDPRILNRKRTP